MTFDNRDKLKMVALYVSGLVVLWGMFVMGWCAMREIYIDVPMLLVLSNIVTGIVSCITTLLVGRTIAQLNQSDGDATVRQTTETVITPKSPPAGNLEVTTQPEVSIVP